MIELRIIIVSGLSGSGKSTVIQSLEDLGFYCVDNLPVVLLTKFIDLCSQSAGEISKIALVIDARERAFFHQIPEIFQELKKNVPSVELIFLETTDEILVRRFSETRRRHPLSPTGSVLEGIQLEREMLKDVRELADRVVDTSRLTIHQLRVLIGQVSEASSPLQRLSIILLSFGYRYGVPYNADLIQDVRFLPNPFFVESLRNSDGLNEEVRKYVLECEETEQFLQKYSELLEYLIPLYEKEGKAYLTIAIGCTGGLHRSVVVAEELANTLEEKNYLIRVVHRDIRKT